MATVNKRGNGGFQHGNLANPKGRPKGSKNREKRLGAADTIAAAQFAKRGLSPITIAKALNATPAAVKEALAGARQILEAFAPEVALNWVDAARVAAADGDHRPAQALLQSIKVVEPVAQTYDTNGAKAVAAAAVRVELHGFTFAGLPTPATDTATAIDVKASTQS